MVLIKSREQAGTRTCVVPHFTSGSHHSNSRLIYSSYTCTSLGFDSNQLRYELLIIPLYREIASSVMLICYTNFWRVHCLVIKWRRSETFVYLLTVQKSVTTSPNLGKAGKHWGYLMLLQQSILLDSANWYVLATQYIWLVKPMWITPATAIKGLLHMQGVQRNTFTHAHGVAAASTPATSIEPRWFIVGGWRDICYSSQTRLTIKLKNHRENNVIRLILAQVGNSAIIVSF